MIDIKNIKKTFQGHDTPTLDDISLSVRPGEFCVIIGPNGGGKSTLLKMVSGDYQPDSGIVSVQGEVAQVVQDVNLGTLPEMTLFENIALSEVKKPKLFFYNRFKANVLRKVMELNCGLEQYIDKPLKTLSGGQRQIVATLMALNCDCKILLLDEHTSALDSKAQDVLMSYITEHVSKKKITVLMITHKIEDALRYGTRLIMVRNGKIIRDLKSEAKQKLTLNEIVSQFESPKKEGEITGGVL
jgi:putative tryptophan/tyrosine transport system ATP-binding protein